MTGGMLFLVSLCAIFMACFVKVFTSFSESRKIVKTKEAYDDLIRKTSKLRRISIVGVEGSGKTVMLAGLGDIYSRPDNKGYFLAPKNFNTSAYVAELMERLRSGIWPAATADDLFQGLEWTLRRSPAGGGRPTDICELSCLDFPGEVYRKAFVEDTNTVAGVTLTDSEKKVPAEMQRQIEALWSYIERADSLIVLVNLGDVITHGLANRRVHESIWVTSAILEQVLKERPGRTIPKTAIVLSQADIYEATIRACGGAKGALEKYLPQVHSSYGWLDVFAAHAIDKTRLNDDGAVVPDPAFTSEGLRPIMDWLLGKEAQQEKAKKPKGSHLRILLILLVFAGCSLAFAWFSYYRSFFGD